MNGPPAGRKELPDKYQPERPDQRDHYRNFVSHDAPTYLRGFIDRVKTLEAIPCSVYPYYGYFEDDYEPEIVSFSKHH